MRLENPKALLLFSAGFDSTVLLRELLNDGYDVTLLFFDYGQKNRYMEGKNVTYWQTKYSLECIQITLPHMSWIDQEKMYIPARNTIFLAYAMSIAEARGFTDIYTGFIDGDAPEAYKDTTQLYTGMIGAVSLYTANVFIHAPYVRMEKDAVKDHAELILELDMRELLLNTFSCNVPKDLDKPCGQCNDCQARAQYIIELTE